VGKMSFNATPQKPKSTPIPWGKPPAPKISGPGIVFNTNIGQQSSTTKSQCENNGGKCASYIGGDKGMECENNFGNDYKYNKALNCGSGNICCTKSTTSSTKPPVDPGTDGKKGDVNNKCIDENNFSVVCPNMVEIQNPYDLNAKLWKYIACPATNDASKNCKMICTRSDKKEKVPCFVGQLDNNNPLGFGPTNEFIITIANSRRKPITINTIKVIDFGWLQRTDIAGRYEQKPNVKLNTNDAREWNITGHGCARDRSLGDRRVEVFYTPEGETIPKNITQNYGCDQRPVINISE